MTVRHGTSAIHRRTPRALDRDPLRGAARRAQPSYNFGLAHYSLNSVRRNHSTRWSCFRRSAHRRLELPADFLLSTERSHDLHDPPMRATTPFSCGKALVATVEPFRDGVINLCP